MGLFTKAPAPAEAPEYIEVGQIVNTHGVRGEVKVQPWDVSAERLCTFKTFYLDGTAFRPLSKRVPRRSRPRCCPSSAARCVCRRASTSTRSSSA